MSKMNELKEKLQARTDSEAVAKKKIDQELAAWPGKLNNLYEQVDRYLEKLKSTGVKVARSSTNKLENNNSIDVPILKISYESRTIKSDPSLFVFGSKGRVDFIGPKQSKLTLLLYSNTEQWHVLIKKPNGTPGMSEKPFSEDDIAYLIEAAFFN